MNRLAPPAAAIFRHAIKLGVFLIMLAPVAAHGAIAISVEQRGSDVVIDYSGSWDNWAFETSFSVDDRAVYGLGLFNTSGAILDVMDPAGQGGMSLDSGSWTNVLTYADSVTGDELGWNNGYTYAPEGYTAGDTLTGSMTFNNTDLTTMGFTPGDSGTWTGGAGTANYTVSAVPEPSTIGLLLGGGLVGVAGLLRKRRWSGFPSRLVACDAG